MELKYCFCHYFKIVPLGTCDTLTTSMWPGSDKEIYALKDRLRVVELDLSTARTDLANEKAARLADKLETLGKMESIRTEMASAVSGLRGKRSEEKPVIAFRNSRDFVAAVEREENLG